MSRPPNPELIEKIVDVVFDLVKQRSVEAITLRMVARRLNITATTIYYYYQDKEELLNRIKIKGFAELDDFVSKAIKPKDTAKNKLKTILNSFYKWCLSNSNLAQLMFVSLPAESKPESKEIFYKGFISMIEIIKGGIEKGEFKQVDAEQEGLLLYSAIFGITTLHMNQRLTEKYNKNADNLIKKTIDLLLGELSAK